ncbi:MAG: hypothetical protein LBR17_07750 [Bacteroidales bacterium]|nr:hypothetical protein [Bacteroidales bacterium]
MLTATLTRIAAFPQAVGITVMKVKSFGLTIAAMGTRDEMVGTAIDGTMRGVSQTMTWIVRLRSFF